MVEASAGSPNGLPKFKVLTNLVSSQINIHRPFGGVVPNLAKREHVKNLPILFRQIFGKGQRAYSLWKKVDLVSVTVGPGLEPALWTGISFAKELYDMPFAISHKPPLVGVNHLEGHLFSFLLPKKKESSKRVSDFGFRASIFPAVSLLVSGGHTILLLMKNLKSWQKLGETRDDAAGEAFDKVARLLRLPYPGGPEIQRLAAKGDPNAIPFPRPMRDQKNYDFSFSGLKTSVLYYLRDNPKADKADVAASFEKAVINVLVYKTIRATEIFKAKSIMLSGGVAANKLLRSELEKATRKMGIRFFVADMQYNTDNAVMIAAAGYMTLLRSRASDGQARLRKKKLRLEARGDLNI